MKAFSACMRCTYFPLTEPTSKWECSYSRLHSNIYIGWNTKILQYKYLMTRIKQQLQNSQENGHITGNLIMEWQHILILHCSMATETFLMITYSSYDHINQSIENITSIQNTLQSNGLLDRHSKMIKYQPLSGNSSPPKFRSSGNSESGVILADISFRR